MFRRDLYYRLDVAHIRVPPLRDRGDDTELLAQMFMAQLRRKYDQRWKELDESARVFLRAHHWPGKRPRAQKQA